jgi:hypothetical protein
LPISIQPYRAEHEPAVAAFNQRLAAARVQKDLVFFTRAEPRWLPKSASPDLYNEFFVALDGDAVRGGYALKTQTFLLPDGTTQPIGYYHHPLSEGLTDKTYAAVGGLLLRDALQRSPLLYCLGMDGYDNPLPQMLIGLGWSHFAVPFFFYVVHAAKFCRNMQALRGSVIQRLLMDLIAFSGLGWTAWRGFQLVRRDQPRVGAHSIQVAEEFDAGMNVLWEDAKAGCSLTAVRDAQTLQTLYPPRDPHLTRLLVNRGGRTVGWAVVGERRKNPRYGDMRVGSVLDCWALPEEEATVAQAATQVLARQNVDLIVSNQSHQRWRNAFSRCGYLTAQSNFIFAASRKLTGLLQPFDEVKERMHFTRADGDGLPWNF